MSGPATQTAGALCREVVDKVDLAVGELAVFDGRAVNGYGEFFDRSLVQSALFRARRALDEADKLFAQARMLAWKQDDPDAL